MEELTEIKEAKLACITSCKQCIEQCEFLENTKCADLCRDCIDICTLSAELTARNSVYSAEVQLLCGKISRACADECAKHGWHDKACKQCTENCLKCSKMCAIT